MRVATAVFSILAVAVASAGTHLLAGLLFFGFTCGAVGESGDSFPAEASPQGRLCASDIDTPLASPGFDLILLSAVLTVALVVLLWRHLDDPWRWLCPLLVLLMPAVTLVLLGVPRDTCSEQARRDHPAYDCITVVDG